MFIEKLFNQGTPFAVMQYFESFKGVKDMAFKKYELLYIRDRSLRYKDLDNDDINFFKQNLNVIKSVVKTKDGEVWEFNNFKAFKQQQLIKH